MLSYRERVTYGINRVFSSLCTQVGRCRPQRRLPQLCRNPSTSLQTHRSRIPAHRRGSRALDPPGYHGNMQTCMISTFEIAEPLWSSSFNTAQSQMGLKMTNWCTELKCIPTSDIVWMCLPLESYSAVVPRPNSRSYVRMEISPWSRLNKEVLLLSSCFQTS